MVRQEKGAIDVLWTSAGTAEEGKLGDITEEHFDATFGLNARGTLFTVQKALPLFNDGGSIFMTGSIASVRGYPSWSVYAASKAALLAYARVWLAELKERGIRVNVLTPGQIVAPGQEQTFDDETKAAMDAREALIPRRRNGSPQEIATVALFLASDDSSFVNGMELVVGRRHDVSLTSDTETLDDERTTGQRSCVERLLDEGDSVSTRTTGDLPCARKYA